MAVTKQQVRVYMSQRKQGKKQTTAAAEAGVSESTGRRIERGAAGKARVERYWRTRQDPFAAVWNEVEEQLKRDPKLQALTLLEWLQERHPGAYPDPLLRTLQRRVKAWRARFGPSKEVMFPQVHGPGLRGLSDFTTLKGVGVTVGGKPLFLHKLRDAERRWIKLRDAAVAVHQDGLHGPESAMRLKAMLTRQRTDRLQIWLTGIAEGNVCASSVKRSGSAAQLQ